MAADAVRRPERRALADRPHPWRWVDQRAEAAAVEATMTFADDVLVRAARRVEPDTLAPVLRERRATFLGFQPPAIGEEEIEAVAETLRSGWLTTGPKAAELEQRAAAYVEAKHVLAVASGTAALHLALLAVGVEPGDEVITTSLTWPATANVIVHAGATPVFADVRESDLNIDPEHVAQLVTQRTKAILPVDLYGQPADYEPLLELGLPIVEDAAHAFESRYRGRKVGSIADATCFSLYATKNVAAGEGGLIATNDDAVAARVNDLRVMRRGHGSRYDIAVPGYKANLSDVLATIALVQLGKLERHGAIRARHFALYDAAVAELEGIEPVARDLRDTHALHLYVVRVDAERAGATRDEYQAALADENIGTSIHFLPVHELTAYRDVELRAPLPVTERAGSEVLSLPLSPAHADDDVQDAVDALRRVHQRFTGARKEAILA
jgi:dTDP-4-amino-4,6-dideoxygalactose transaminase